MSQQIKELKNGISLTQFYGGSDLGICVQLTSENGFIQLTKDEAEEMVRELQNWIKKQN